MLQVSLFCESIWWKSGYRKYFCSAIHLAVDSETAHFVISHAHLFIRKLQKKWLTLTNVSTQFSHQLFVLLFSYCNNYPSIADAFLPAYRLICSFPLLPIKYLYHLSRCQITLLTKVTNFGALHLSQRKVYQNIRQTQFQLGIFNNCPTFNFVVT